MKRSLFLSFILALNAAYAQNWQWARPTRNFLPTNYSSDHPKLITADHKLYAYKARYPGSSPWNYDPAYDTNGTNLRAYSYQGHLLAEKQWKMPFHIHQLEYDGLGHFFFAASFYGTLVIDGHVLRSAGGFDGAVGRMDLDGKIEWVHTFGGPGHDAAETICFDKAAKTVYVGGKIKDTLTFDNTQVSVNDQSGILVQYSNHGVKLRHKLFSFTPVQKQSQNAIVSVCHTANGSIFMLMDRDGQHWNSWPISMPVIGRYLVKLSHSLDTLWSRYIIGPSCYYGWACSDLKVSANGDAYLARKCSGKYGGSCRIVRYDGITGAPKWSHDNPDGIYTDLCIDSTTLILIGTEGANGCPCPGSFAGHQTIKLYDEQNNLRGESRVEHAYFQSLTADGEGAIFIGGALGRSGVRIGPDTLSPVEGSANFIARLSDLPCTVPQVNYTPPQYPYMPEFTICGGQSATLSVTPGPGTYSWTNGATGSSASITSSGTYYAVHTQPNGCVAYSLPVVVEVNDQARPRKPLLATYDSATKRNIIVAAKYDYDYDINRIRLFRKLRNDVQVVNSYSGAAVQFDFSLALSDTVTDPDAGDAIYYLQTVDTCGNVSELSEPLNSVFLTGERSTGHQVTLKWNKHLSPVTRNYFVYRGKGPGSMTQIAVLDSSTLTFIDPAPLAGNTYYQVAAGTYTLAVNTRKFENSRSNLWKVQGFSTDVAERASSIRVFPNPAQQEIVVSLGDSYSAPVQVNLTNALGQLVYSGYAEANGKKALRIDLSGQSKGVYMVECIVADCKIRRRIIKQ